MKICFLVSDLSWSGGTIKMTSLLSNALSHRHEVYILSLHQERDFCLFPVKKNVCHIVLTPTIDRLCNLTQIKEIHQFIKQNQIFFLSFVIISDNALQ